ncbi:Ribosomal RNA small subunit methyltransferase C [Kordia antarctica]|uniref:Ribosomal RNA small subunit methyltransferase C n=1 Tax=Kordia antarctica TaxID=1218801 RepID=A0A7L4ZNV3_9FLAO|nr:methyltransferase [Kordia antarctica]QHI38109.1 Ribosomal RNA small subunit methyltransferase C [Kordia antarctica]
MFKKLKKIIFPVAKFAFDKYTLKQRSYTYEGIEVKISAEVFPPHFTLSTKILLDFIKPLNLTNKTFLELGCGSGIISLFAASKGAKVIASDINQIAIGELKLAAIKNEIDVTIVYSDLFENLVDKTFEYIIINPPYYPKAPKNDKERAWFCGENFEYFEKLFAQLPQHIAPNTWMILSEDCEIEHIKQLASKNGLSFALILEKSVVKEKNYIFSIQKL